MPVLCVVMGCVNRSGRDKVSFHSVPAALSHRFLTYKNELSKQRRELWLAAIGRSDLTDTKLKYQKVCSKHFISGKPASLEDLNNPDWVPSQDMGHISQNVQKEHSHVERKTEVRKEVKQPEPCANLDVGTEDYEEDLYRDLYFVSY